MNSEAANTAFKTVLAMCQVALKQRAADTTQFLTTADIIKTADEVLAMPSFAGVDRERLLSELEARFTVVTAEHKILAGNDDHKAWLPSKHDTIQWRYWDRYLLHLAERMSASAVDSVHKVTNEVLERLEDPERPGAWDRRGLVMGHVQSGKTANYCGLVCKAADAGYKVIIVLAGIHNSLRSQTQIRLEEGFLGFMNDTFGTAQQTFKPVGVGLMDSSIRANTGTSRIEKGDFNETVAKQFGIHPGGLPLLFVVKKHVGVLNNLFKWIRSCADAQEEATGRKFVRNVPALIIDDEADLASVDTRQQDFDENGQPDEDHDPAKTNRNIRLLLRSFEKVAYVGYTATPFANIYIHENGSTKELGDDLFPRSFIINIPAPSNYMGPARIFGLPKDEDAGLEEVPPLPIVRTVSDHADSDKFDETSGWMPPKLEQRTEHKPRYQGRKTVPPTLREAIMAFLLATAVRKQRETGPLFNSMLVHVVRYTKVQKEVATQVELALKDIQQRLRNGDGDRKPTILEEFHTLWTHQEKGFEATSALCSQILENRTLPLPPWETIHPSLEAIAAGIRIKTINGSAGDALDYEEHRETGMDIIAIGGDKLSRGLTLEGLSVSYFLRSSRMYDTLMQMGRWFGYREKYIDVCRLYTTKELLQWFTHIAAASEELQREFDYMVGVRATPREYGLKVRSHPALLVTSAVKMRHGTEMRLSYSGQRSQTIIFSRDPESIRSNFQLTSDWLASLSAQPPEGSFAEGYIWRNVPAPTLTTFLEHYGFADGLTRMSGKMLSSYIQKQNAKGELVNWTVHLVSNSQDHPPTQVGKFSVGLNKRKLKPEADKQLPGRYSIGVLTDPKDEMADLSQPQQDQALELTRQRWKDESRDGLPQLPGGKEIRVCRDKSKGLLLLYPLRPDPELLPADTKPIIGLAVSFPKGQEVEEITYTVNNVFTTRGGDDDGL